MTFTLGALFAFTTFATILLALGRAFGFVATAFFVATPFPLIGYLVLIRWTMGQFKVDHQSRWLVTNLVMAIGLFIAALFSLALLSAGLANLSVAGSEWLA